MAKKSDPVVAREPDEYEGQGGSYLIDPVTGKRQLLERTKHTGEKETDKRGDAVAADPTAPQEV